MENSFLTIDTEVLEIETVSTPPNNNSQLDNGITFTGLDPILGSLGVLIGLLTAKPEPNTYVLNGDWFLHPIDNTEAGIKQNPDQFQALLGQVLGQIGGNVLGIPVQDAALLGTWYPIMNGAEPTGFYVVSYDKGQDTVLGLGVLHNWKVPETNSLLSVNVWGLLPFVRIGNGSFHITLTEPGFPLNVGVSAEGAVKGQPLVDVNGVSFNGVKFSASVDLPAPDPFDVTLEILSLRLPGDEKPTNRSLADLLAISGEQILETAASLFIGALSQAFPTLDKSIHYLPPLFGLSSTIPDLPQVKMPILPWYDLFQVASDPVKYPFGVRSLFFNWFNEISTDPQLLQGWLSCLGGFLGSLGQGPGQGAGGSFPGIGGSGTRTDPYAVNLIKVPVIGNLNFTVATTVTDTGIRNFYPGLSLRGTPVALGTSPSVFVIQADLELGTFTLNGLVLSVSPDIQFAFQFSLNDKDPAKPLLDFNGYKVDALVGGMAFGTGGRVMPRFFLNKLVTPDSSFDSVNLLSPAELANAGATVLSDALKTLIGVGQESFSDNIAALVGLIAPASAGANWPAELPPPFSSDQMVHSILNPVAAFANYYLKTLQYEQPVDGKAAFSYLVTELALLLENFTGNVQIKVDGTGTASDPWKAGISLNQQSLPAYITAYRESITGGATGLVIGISLAPTITILGVDIVPALSLEGIRIVFPSPATPDLPIAADWLPNVSASLSLPQPFQTPAVGGVSVSVKAAQLSAQWSRVSSGWSWSMFVNAPALIIDGQTVALGQDLNFDNQTALKDLVHQYATTFSPFMVAAFGTLLMRTETRAGLFTTGFLGFLSDISGSPIWPTGLQWKGFSQLTLTSLSDPWPDVRTHIASNFNTSATAGSLLSLLAWTINTSLVSAPAITGTGSFDDPYITPLPKGFNMPVWYDVASKIIGTGAGLRQTWDYELSGVKFRFDLDIRLNLLSYDLTNGKLIFDGKVPSLSLLGTLSNPDGLLVDLPAAIGSIGKLIIGFELQLKDGQINFTPVVDLVNVTFPDKSTRPLVTLEDFLSVDFEAAAQNAFMALLNAGIQMGIAQVKDKTLFKTAYELLGLLGLTLVREREDDPYGINAAGWNGLLSDFNSYMTGQLQALLLVPAERQRLFAFLQQICQVTVPPFPPVVLELLYALDICGPADQGYPLDPTALLQLASDPYTGLKTRFERLYSVDGVVLLAELTAQMMTNIAPVKYGKFTFSTDANGVISLEVLPADSFNMGSLFLLFGAVRLDLSNTQLTAEINVYCPRVGLTLHNMIQLHYVKGEFQTAYEASLVWGDGAKPAATPLVLIPFDPTGFLDQLGDLAPAFSLNILLNAVVEDQLLKKYPLVQQIFTGLGLATQALVDQGGTRNDLTPQWEMVALMGILRDPLGWLLSDAVLGYNGKFNVAALVRMLSNLPAVSASNGISLAPTAQGMRITGLPYDFQVEMGGVAGVAEFKFLVKDIPIAGEWGILKELNFTVSVDEQYQPAFAGNLTMASGSKIPVPFFVNTGYDKLFFLNIGQGTLDDPNGLSLQLLPFLGWGTLVQQATRLFAAALLNQVVPMLLQQLATTGASDFANKMLAFGKAMDVTDLVNRILAVLGGSTSKAAARAGAQAGAGAGAGNARGGIPKPLGGISSTRFASGGIAARQEYIHKARSYTHNVYAGRLNAGVVEPMSAALAAGAPGDLFDQVQTVALQWLQERFSVANAPTTVDAMIALLSDVITTGLSRQDGLFVYKPSDKLPITIKAGLNGNALLGLWVDLNLPETDLFKVDITQAGIGVKPDGSVEFSFGVHLLVPIDGPVGPALGLEYAKGSGFVLNFDPLGDMTNFSYKSALSRELLPSFFPAGAGDPVDLGDRVTAWLLDVVKIVLPRYVSALVLNLDSVKQWLEAPIITSEQPGVPTPAILLEAVSLILQENKRYYLNTVDNLLKLTPEGFFGNLFFTLMKQELVLFTFGKNNSCSISVGPRTGVQDYYGIRVVAPGLTLDALPNLVLQLGDNAPGADEWIKKTNGPTGQPGVGFFVPITSSGGEVTVDFSFFQVLLYNLGFDIVGVNGKPIVDLARFKIGAISPRTVFELDFKGSGSPEVGFGAALTLQKIAISLAPDTLVQGDAKNPVANNILGSGTEDSKGNPPSNPTFDVTAAYTKNLWINLKSDSGNGHEVILPIQRSFGPLYIDSLGLGWEDGPQLLDFIFSGTVDLAGLKASLIGLRVGIPVTTPTDFKSYTVDLDGLDISFKGGPVEINGGFLKQEGIDEATGKPYVEYTGVAVLKAGTFSLLALGSYAEIPTGKEPNAPTAPSLFIFAVLNTPLGGPPAFFITGIAAGFSFNRSISIPPVTEVQDFPLLRCLVDGTFSEGEDPGKALVQLSSVVRPEVGEYWVAAGIKFSSFELITTSALLFISFGKDFEINLLGLSFASLPPMIPKQYALAYFELAIKVSFKPSAGIISAEAQLTPNSFVLSTDCKVTGGFAFYLWYKTIVTKEYIIPAGDFVISLGGYHPSFQKPVYYPDVPRLGMQWKMAISVGSISIGGGAYFALCPTAVMAGGYIDVAFELGPLKAWMNAYANFLIEWKPFYFSVDIGITVGASFGTEIAGVSVTIKAELGAKLHLEGPPCHGYAHVDWYVISFTIPIGEGDTMTKDENVNWVGFEEAFLPPPAPVNSKAVSASSIEAAARRSGALTGGIAGNGNGHGNGTGHGKVHGQDLPADPLLVQQVVKWNAETGLLNQSDDGLWTIQPYPFAFAVKSAIPSPLTTVTDSGFSEPGIPVGVRPMGYSSTLNSPLTITVTDGKGVTVNLASRNIKMTIYNDGAPAALWSKDTLNRSQPPDPKTMLIPGASFGVQFDGDEYVYVGTIPEFDILNLEFAIGDPKLLPYKNVAKYPAAALYPDADQQIAYTVIKRSIMAPEVITQRNSVYAALEAGQMEAPANPDLTVMASSANFILQALPVVARVGIYQNGGNAEMARPVRQPALPAAISAQQPRAMKEPRLQALLRRYKASSDSPISANTGDMLRGGNANPPTEAGAGIQAGSGSGSHGKWTYAGGLSGKKVLARTRSVKPSASEKLLYDGSLILWKVDDHQTETTIDLAGKLPSRIASFDAHGNLLSYQYFEGAAQYTLPTGTAQVAVAGDADGRRSIAGWNSHDLLSKVNPAWSMADAALVKVQNSNRIRVKSRYNSIGHLPAADLLAGNYVSGRGNVRIRGWIQTVLPAQCRYAGILLNRPGLDGNALSVGFSADAIPMTNGSAQAIAARTSGDSTLIIYTLPDGEAAKDYCAVLAALTPAAADADIRGVFGFQELPGENDPQLRQVQTINNAGLDLRASDPVFTKVTIASKMQNV